MATQRNKLINDAPAWNEKQRYKVNAVVVYNDFVYQNITGSNSIPSLLTDWIKVSINDLIDFIPIGGTDVGNPVIGDIEFDNLNGNKRIKGNSSGSYIEFIDDGAININYESGSNVRINNLNIKERLSGESDYSNIDPENKLIYAQRSYVDNQTGWGDYVDDEFDSISPFSISTTPLSLPNNKATVIETQKPDDVTTFYDGTVITGRNGDGILVTIDFIAKPTSPGTTFIEIWLDITGGAGTPVNLANLYKRIISFPKGNGIERPINFTFSGYTLGTWEANGAVIKVVADNTLDIYNIRYVITRTHKAK